MHSFTLLTVAVGVCLGCAGGVSSPGAEPSAEQLRTPSWWLEHAFDAATDAATQTEGRERRNLLHELIPGILRLQAQAGDTDAAKKTAEWLEFRWPREDEREFFFNIKLAEWYARAGNIEVAIEAAEKAKRLVEAFEREQHEASPGEFVPSRRWLASTFVDIVREQAKQGDLAGAETLARTIDQPEYRGHALMAVAYEIADRDLEAALTVLRSLPHESRDSMLVFAEKAREAGRWEIVSEIIRSALERAEQRPLAAQGGIYQYIAEFIAETNSQELDAELVQQARRAILEFTQRPRDESTSEHQYQEAIESAASGLISLKMYDAARQAMEKVDQHGTSVLNTKLAAALAQEGRYDEAVRAAKQAMRPHNAFQSVAFAQARRGDFQIALGTVELSEDEESKIRAYSEIAVIQARGGQFAAAKETLGKIEPPRGPGTALATARYHQVHGLTAIAREQTEAGEPEEAGKTLEEALEIARSATGEGERIGLIKEVARGLARAGDFEQARELAAQVDAVDLLVWLAEQHLEAGRKQRFEEVLRQAQERLTSDLGKESTGTDHVKVAALLLRVGRLEEAEQTVRQLLEGADKMQPSIYKMVSYAVAGAFYAHIDELDDFWRHASALDDPLDRAYATTGAAMAPLEPERWSKAWTDARENAGQ